MCPNAYYIIINDTIQLPISAVCTTSYLHEIHQMRMLLRDIIKCHDYPYLIKKAIRHDKSGDTKQVVVLRKADTALQDTDTHSNSHQPKYYM